jgi:hypothetical protein
MSMEKFVAMRELTRTCGLVLAALLSTAGAARADSGLGPADAEKTLGRLGYLCMIQSLCPLTAANYATLKRAVAGHRDDEYLLGLNLIHGDGLPTDHIAGVAWVVKAARRARHSPPAMSKGTCRTASISRSTKPRSPRCCSDKPMPATSNRCGRWV